MAVRRSKRKGPFETEQVESRPRRSLSGRMWIALAMISGGLVVAFAMPRAKPAVTDPVLSDQFQPTVENTKRPSGPAPEGMVWIPGGEFSMGAQIAPNTGDTVGMQATDRFAADPSRLRGRLLDGRDRSDERTVRRVRQGTGYVTVAERDAARGRFSRRAAGEAGRRLGGLLASRPSRAARTIPIDGGLRQRRELAPSARPGEHHRGQGTISRRARRLRRALAYAHGPASVCRPKRNGSLPRAAGYAAGSSRGATNSSRTAVDGQQPQGHFPDHDTGADALHGPRAGRAISAERIRAVRRGRERLGVGERLVPPGLLRAVGSDRRRRAQSARSCLARSIPANPARRSACTAADRSSAPIGTARATWSARAGRVTSARGRTISGFA